MTELKVAPEVLQPQDTPATDVATPSGSLEVAGARDVTMSNGPVDAPSPTPTHMNLAGRTGTPVRHVTANGERLESSSRAASAHSESTFTIPAEAPTNGAPVRQYINAKVTGPLLEGMKMLAKEQPRDPLRVLGEYLLQRSRELEGTKRLDAD